MPAITRLLALALASALGGCGAAPGAQTVFAPAPVSTVSVASAATRAQPIDVTLRLSLPNPSWGYDSTAVEVDDANHVVTLRPQMRSANPDGISIEVLKFHTATTSFTPGATGVYHVRVEGGYKPVSADVTVTE